MINIKGYMVQRFVWSFYVQTFFLFFIWIIMSNFQVDISKCTEMNDSEKKVIAGFKK